MSSGASSTTPVSTTTTTTTVVAAAATTTTSAAAAATAAATSASTTRPRDEILYMGFNQDQTCFSVGTNRGFHVFACDPLKERFSREWNAGVGIVETLLRCNILAIVGGGDTPKFPKNKLMIWDDFANHCIAELEFKSSVRGVKLRRERIVVALESVVYVYNFSDLGVLHQIDTAPNPRGICALSYRDSIVIAAPGAYVGHVTLVHDQPAGATLTIAAHSCAIVALALSMDGRLLATASEKGTLVRIFDTATGHKLKEVRRGADMADIYSINFSSDNTLLIVSSSKGTCHIFGLADAENRQSALWSFRSILPAYFSSEWSFAQFPIPGDRRTFVCFGPDKNTVFVISENGTFSKITLEQDNGTIKPRFDTNNARLFESP